MLAGSVQLGLTPAQQDVAVEVSARRDLRLQQLEATPSQESGKTMAALHEATREAFEQGNADGAIERMLEIQRHLGTTPVGYSIEYRSVQSKVQDDALAALRAVLTEEQARVWDGWSRDRKIEFLSAVSKRAPGPR